MCVGYEIRLNWEASGMQEGSEQNSWHWLPCEQDAKESSETCLHTRTHSFSQTHILYYSKLDKRKQAALELSEHVSNSKPHKQAGR